MSRPYKIYDVTLVAREQVSPTFVRLTLRGDDLADCSPTLLDQRVKLLFGDDEALDLMLTSGDDWYAALVAAGARGPKLRTYTLISVTPDTDGSSNDGSGNDGSGEVQLDVAVHPLTDTDPSDTDHAPGMQFATSAPLGARTLLVAGDRRVEGHDRVGVAWRTEATGQVLLVGDETALPAVLNIVSTLPDDARGRVVLEVPHADDVRDVVAPAGVTVDWRVRERGERAVGVFGAAVAASSVADDSQASDQAEILWDELDQEHLDATGGRQAWVAGEASWVRTLRAEAKAAGVPKQEVSFMGYWKRGVAGS
ncbi:siderophore-interacting protein [Aestuariimicrobium soli]|uniref:siderophore-interacting protein n=1 Tax=Aestuariimicrobium soli TaxID=2035834 RepID=UPI003EBD8C4C